MISRLLTIAATLLWSILPSHASQDPPVIAAASDLQFALTDIAEAFRSRTGQEVKLAFGSTGNLTTQILEGAPFQMFLAADESFVDRLVQAGLTRDEGTLYAEGRLVLMVPHGSLLVPDAAMDNLAALIDAGELKRFAIANPEHAPYGQRAAQALQHQGLWQRIQPFLVVGENVSQAAQFALSGNAQGGLVAYSLALAPQVGDLGTFVLIPKEWHDPLLQRMVLLKNADPVTEAFYTYMQSREARDIMVRYGFLLPEGG